MKTFKEETKSVLAKVDVCPRCKNYLEQDIGNERIQCSACGLRIKLSSKYKDLYTSLAISGICVAIFMIGSLYGLLF